MCKNLIYENTPSKQSTFDIYIYMFHDKQARDEKKRIYGYMVLTIIYMNTNIPDSVPVNEKKKYSNCIITICSNVHNFQNQNKIPIEQHSR